MTTGAKGEQCNPMKARLVSYRDGQEDLTFPILDKQTTIGRDADNFIQLPDRMVSKHHAVIHTKPDGWEIEDLGSTNGVLVQGARVKVSALKQGDSVAIGPFTLVFQTSDKAGGWGPPHHVIDLSTQAGLRTISR